MLINIMSNEDLIKEIERFTVVIHVQQINFQENSGNSLLLKNINEWIEMKNLVRSEILARMDKSERSDKG